MKSTISLILIFSCLAFGQFTQTVVSLTGETKDGITEKTINSTIKVKDKTGKTINRVKSKGSYFITGLKSGKTYDLEISASGYFTRIIEYYVPNTDKYAEFSRDFVLQSKAVESKIPIKVIPFDLNKSKLRTGADYIFDDILAIMKNNRRAKFAIQVFAEGTKSPEENKQIAQKRANTIKEFLLSHKVKSQLVIDAQSTIDPDNPPPAGKTSKGKRYKGSIYIVLKELKVPKHKKK